MSQRTNTRKAFKLCRMMGVYGAGERRMLKTLRSSKHLKYLPARHKKWVAHQVRLEVSQPWLFTQIENITN